MTDTTRWTPGPWRVESDGTSIAMAGEGCIVAPGPDRAPNAEKRANARLIAAAPLLVEALEALEFAARIDCPRTEAWGTLLETCRAALAAARGETP